MVPIDSIILGIIAIIFVMAAPFVAVSFVLLRLGSRNRGKH